MYLGSSFSIRLVPRIRQRDFSLSFDFIVSPLQLLSARLRSVYLMVQWSSSSYWWFSGVCETSQPSWGGGLAGIPPHAWMTSSFSAFDAAPYIWWCWPSRLQHLFDFHVSVRFCEPFPISRGIWVVFVSHVLRYYCISPGCYPRHIMYVGFLIISFI